MSIRAAYRGPSARPNPDEFLNSQEMMDFVSKRYFSRAQPGEPFFLVTRRIASDFGEGARLRVEYYVGVLSEQDPILRQAKEHGLFDSLRIETDRYLEIDGRMALAERPLEFSLIDLNYTPLRKPFEAPAGQFGLLSRRTTRCNCLPKFSAFSMAVGITAMERLCVHEAEMRQDLPIGYLRAAGKLGIEVHSLRLKEMRKHFAMEVMTKLLVAHLSIARLQRRIQQVRGAVGQTLMEGGALTIVTDDVAAVLMTSGDREESRSQQAEIRSLLKAAREAGAGEITDPVSIAGIRYRPKELIEDFEQLYKPV